MPFIPHTEQDIKEMLSAIGVDSIEALFSEIPPSLLIEELKNIPQGMNEMQAGRLMQVRANTLSLDKCYIGAGAYEHHIPQAVWDITMRGEFLSAYTPYQAEASQGTLQLLWEYQTMMSSLMGMQVSNASLYDGATSLAESVLMACRLLKKKADPIIWVPQTIHPYYRQVLKAILSVRNIRCKELNFDKNGTTQLESGECDILVVSQPNFFGILEPVNELCDWAHAHDALVIGVANPLACALLKPPGQWGTKGADIACGEGQPLGIPLSSGGPYFGFLCTKNEFIRQLPGRIVGKTTDANGNPGFTLTLQAREQHIRREKATSNICTNQGLLVTAATIYMSLLGAKGLKAQALSCYERCQFLIEQLASIGLKPYFQAENFHEVVVGLSVDANTVINKMAEKGYAAGLALEQFYPQLKNTLLICVTETKTDEDIVEYVKCLGECLN